ncbi:MAG: sensor histidine kinase [Prevotella sp.]|jgi:LytS/YehU family sensor histidine kinase|nr:sensor histidine kinase [Prevotella sp.]
MKNKKQIFLFIVTTALVLFTCQWAYRALDGDYGQTNFLYQYLINLPACFFIGAIDFLIINTLYKKFKWKDNAVRIVVDLLLTSLVAILFAIVGNSILSPFNVSDYMTKFALSLVIWNTIMVLLIEIFFYNQRQAEAEKRLATAEKEKLQYQYKTLKAQINPHFLFNSLNVLSSLTYQDAEKANLFAKKMSGVYRYLLLTNDRPTVTLREELSFLDSYIFLEQIRFEDALFMKVINGDTNLNRKVIPVSLQLLVENAIKHNVTTINEPLTIRIYISDQSITTSNNLQLRSSVDKGEVGLNNLQRQYALYNKSIDIRQTDREFIVEIPFIE